LRSCAPEAAQALRIHDASHTLASSRKGNVLRRLPDALRNLVSRVRHASEALRVASYGDMSELLVNVALRKLARLLAESHALPDLLSQSFLTLNNRAFVIDLDQDFEFADHNVQTLLLSF